MALPGARVPFPCSPRRVSPRDMPDVRHIAPLLALLLCAVIYRLTLAQRPRGPPLPPGPRASLLASSAVPKRYPWKVYAQWRNTYGASDRLLSIGTLSRRNIYHRRSHLHTRLRESHSRHQLRERRR